MKSSVNEVWIKSAFYVFNTVFDREYNRKLKKDKKNSPAGIWTHNFEKNSHFRKELLKKSHFKRVTKKEWHHMNKAWDSYYQIFTFLKQILFHVDLFLYPRTSYLLWSIFVPFN